MGHQADIIGMFDHFEIELREALAHFFDPIYTPPNDFSHVLGCDHQGVECLWAAILNAVEDLKPAAETPPQARGWRIYHLLSLRYAKELTQEAAAEQLGITTRHLRREQQHALRLLARRLWERHLRRDRPKLPQPPNSAPPDEGDEAWRAQVRQELESLQQGTPGAATPLGDTLKRALELSQPLLKTQGLSARVQADMPDVLVEVHPSILSQLLLGSIEALVATESGGDLSIGADTAEHHLILRLLGAGDGAHDIEIPRMVRELARLEGLSIQTVQRGIELDLPVVEECVVLVIDDNIDLVHFYRRYTANTRYRIVTPDENQDMMQAVARAQPDIIVLDVMLPDTDGWELLGQLQQSPAARHIPIIVCSVTQGKALAASLGAALYVAKPVRRQQFLEALAQVSSGIQQQT